MRSSAYSLPSSADANSSRIVANGCPAARRRRRSDACEFRGSPRSRLRALCVCALFSESLLVSYSTLALNFFFGFGAGL